MPYKNYRRKTYRKNYRRKNYRAKSSSAKALRMAKYACHVASPEYKFIDNSATGVVTSSGTAFLMALPSQGTGSQQRIGATIEMKKWFVNMKFTYDSAGNSVQRIRVILAWWRTLNNTVKAVTDFLETPTLLAHRELDTGKRVKFLFDKIVEVHSQKPSALLRVYRHINERVRFDKTLTGGSIADVEEGCPFVVLISDQATANYPSYSIQSRYRYTDS